MKNYFVRIGVDIPYPKEFDFTINGSNPGTAAARAYRKLRLELPKRKIKEYRLKIIQL